MTSAETDLAAFAASLVEPLTDADRQQFRDGYACGLATDQIAKKHTADPSGGTEAGWFWRQGFDHGHMRRPME